MKNKVYVLILSIVTFQAYYGVAQVFESKENLYTNLNAKSGWYTGNEYSAIATYNGNIYFIMLDDQLKPFIGKLSGDNTTLEALEKSYPNYTAYDDGHHEFSIGIDRDGYIHVTGDMHNFPSAEISNTLPESYKNANMLYWKSSYPEDITDFKFIGLTPEETVPGKDWSYGRFVRDRYNKLYYISRTLARKQYYQNGGRGLGLYSYDETTKLWKAYGTTAPKTDASFPVVAWEESGVNGGSYQQFKGDICFDKNNRMYLTTGMNTQNGPSQVNSVIFAYSDDGGESFKKMNGMSITLPMQIASGSRQGDVIDSDPTATFEQPSVTYAFNNNPVIQYTASGGHFYKYWNGTQWSERISSPVQTIRGRILFNEHENVLLFIHIQSGTIYAKSSFTGTSTSYNAGDTFRAFDPKLFYEENILLGVSWKASTGKFDIIKLTGHVRVINQSPTCTIISPTNNSSYTAAASIGITANATDSDGTITKVEFFNGSEKLGERTIAPYTFSWTNVAAGTYSLTARATDNQGATTTSSVISITINDPIICQEVTASADDGNVPENVLDEDFNTRWSAEGDGQYIEFCFDDTITVYGTHIAFFRGDERSNYFSIDYTINGIDWLNILTNQSSSGSSLDYEYFSFPSNIEAWKLRIIGHGNSANNWNSFTEVDFQLEDLITRLNNSEIKKEDIFYVYPNPVKDQLIVEMNERKRNTDIIITNTLGQIVFQQAQSMPYATRIKIDIHQLQSGIYFIKLGNITHKFIKQ